MTRREQLERLTAGTWPHPDLMRAVEALADQLHTRCGINPAQVTCIAHTLFMVSASAAERQHARDQLQQYAALLDQFDCDAETMDTYRRCGPAPATV